VACNCNKGRIAAASTPTGTYRVMVNNRQVYESSSETAAQSVADRFDNATILSPGETA
jgi:hypothetical protein